MKQLPEAARAIVERARDAHDPSEAQLQDMLAGLHAKLGYGPAPSEPGPPPEAAAVVVDRARGLLHAKLLKLVLSLAALGGVIALVAPRVSTPERSVVALEQPAPVAPEASAQPTAIEAQERNVQEQPEALAVAPTQRAQAKQPPKAERRAAKVRSASPPAPAVVSAAATSGAELPSVAASELTAPIARSADAPKEKVQLSVDVVPLQTARKRAEATAPGASDADELRLIDRAASLLRDGEPEEALELLREHGRKFPASQLELERRGLSVLARCGAGQVEQGRRERAEFLRDAGRAPIAARVRRACPESQP